MTLDARRARIARNESSFRAINDELEQGLRQVRQAPELKQFVCECGDSSCDALIQLTFEEYAAVRAHSHRFAIAPGHDFPSAERVVQTGDRYEVVEKIGEAADLVRALDRRSPSEPPDVI